VTWPPERIPKALAPFSIHRDGWVRWYRGKTRFVCGRIADVDAVERAWQELKDRVEKQEPLASTPDTITLRELLGLFMARQRRRMDTGKPKPLSPFTFRDYANTLAEFFKRIGGASRRVSALTPADFDAYARSLDTGSPITWARKVAYVRSMFNWGAESGLIADPQFGPDFVPPPAQKRRDHRLSKEKSYTPQELAALWRAARREERVWIALGINCAFDNSDVATLTGDCIDFAAGVIDFRRRKVGKVRRVIPLHPRTARLLRACCKSDGLVFGTPNGLPLVRLQPSKANPLKQTSIDHIAGRWDKLVRRAGLRTKLRTAYVDGKRVQVREGKGDGRGFRSLRTTFVNLAPAGYRDEVEIVTGHAQGTILLDHYLERVGVERLRELVNHVWHAAFKRERQAGQAGSRSTRDAAP
jgi:integrase